jgi:hypothetical protein
MVADGMTVDEVLADFPYLEAGDIAEALRYAAEAVRERELPLRPGGMRFLVDASMSPVVVQELGTAGHDAVHVGEVLRLDAPDADILEYAARRRGSLSRHLPAGGGWPGRDLTPYR